MQKTFAIVLKPGVSDAEAVFRQLHAAWPHARYIGEAMGHHAVPAHLQDIERLTASEIEAQSDLMVVIGGDGTLIHGASLFTNRVVPILGINLGHIGFLTEVARDELMRVLPLVEQNALPHSDRMRLEVELWRGKTQMMRHVVLNDAIVAMRSLARIATYRITQGDTLVTTVRGDGVMVSTPTGSTAYALAAGGPIISPHLEAISLTPICPHQLTQRPLVLRPDEGDLRITLDSDNTVFASLDGHVGLDLVFGDSVVVRPAKVPTRLLGVPWRDYYQTLRTKLRWGQG
jgi:NAD+ kinase